MQLIIQSKQEALWDSAPEWSNPIGKDTWEVCSLPG